MKNSSPLLKLPALHPGRLLWGMLALSGPFWCCAATQAADHALAAGRARIEQMSQAELDRLARSRQRFNELSAPEQQQLRDLQAAIESSPRSAELLRVMDAYHAWLKTLSPGQRAELVELPFEQRVAEIKRLRVEHQQTEALRSIGLSDVRELSNWLRAHYEPRILAVLSQPRRRRFEQLPPAVRGIILLDLYSRMLRVPEQARQWHLPDEDQLTDLHRRLSEPAQRRLESTSTVEGKQRIVVGWIREVGRRMSSREWSSHIANVSDEELTDFFENELDTHTREQLLMLPPEAMWSELRHEYLRRELPELNPPRIGPIGPTRGDQ